MGIILGIILGIIYFWLEIKTINSNTKDHEFYRSELYSMNTTPDSNLFPLIDTAKTLETLRMNRIQISNDAAINAARLNAVGNLGSALALLASAYTNVSMTGGWEKSAALDAKDKAEKQVDIYWNLCLPLFNHNDNLDAS